MHKMVVCVFFVCSLMHYFNNSAKTISVAMTSSFKELLIDRKGKKRRRDSREKNR